MFLSMIGKPVSISKLQTSRKETSHVESPVCPNALDHVKESINSNILVLIEGQRSSVFNA